MERTAATVDYMRIAGSAILTESRFAEYDPRPLIMRHVIGSPDFRDGFVEMLPACIGLIPFGLVCGVGAAAAGADFAAALGMSAIIFSGAAQILAAQLIAAGAPVAVIVLTCVGAGPALPDVQRRDGAVPRGRCRRAGSARSPSCSPTRRSRRRSAASTRTAIRARGALHFVGGGTALWGSWQIDNVVGYFAGNVIPASWSLEFAVPLCFIALLAPALKSVPPVVAAVVAGVAVLALDALPMRLNLIAAGVLGIVAGTVIELARERWKAR